MKWFEKGFLPLVRFYGKVMAKMRYKLIQIGKVFIEVYITCKTT